MKSISRKGARGRGCALRLAGPIVLIPGLIVFYFFSVAPLGNWLSAQDWVETPCTVLESDVGVHPSSDGGPTYSIDIVYEYTWEGVTYQGDRYNFMGGSSSGRRGKEHVVGQYPVGSERVCFVDPRSPDDAVLNRDFTATYLIGMGGLAFSLAFFAALVLGTKKSRNSLSVGAARHDGAVPVVPVGDRIELKGDSSSWTGLAFILLFALIWNGIVLGVCYGIWSDFDAESIEWFPLLFMIPFVLVGLGFVVATFYCVLALFNPKPDLVLSPGYLPLGSTATISWAFRGNPSRIRQLKISLIGEEKATYRRGTDTVTDTNVFHRVLLAEHRAARDIARGEVDIVIPEFTAPSFDGPNNKIRWYIQLEGDIPRWPDVGQDFTLTVAPLPSASSGATPARAEFQRN